MLVGFFINLARYIIEWAYNKNDIVEDKKEAKVPPNIRGHRTENHSGTSPSLHFQKKIGKNEQ